MTRSTIWCISLMLLANGSAHAQESLVVAAVKNTLVSHGVDLSGSCGAFQITRRVAWELRAQGWGLLGGKTPAQNGCQFGNDKFSSDYLLKADGSAVDILGDAGGANSPQWNLDSASPAWFRVAPDPGDSPSVPPTPPTQPSAPSVDLSPLIDQLIGLQSMVRELQQRLADLTAAQLQATQQVGAALATPPSYQGRLFGYPVTLRPVK